MSKKHNLVVDEAVAKRRIEDLQTEMKADLAAEQDELVSNMVAERMPVIAKLFEKKVADSKIRSRSLALERAVDKRFEFWRQYHELQALKTAKSRAREDLQEHPEYLKLKSRLEGARRIFDVHRTPAGTINRVYPDGSLAQIVDELKKEIAELEATVDEVFDAEIAILEDTYADAIAWVENERLEWAQRSAAK